MEYPPIHCMVYADTGIGKSTFASTFPKPMLVFHFDPHGKDWPYRKDAQGNTLPDGGLQQYPINVGNGHTMAAIISNGTIVGVVEHHTRLLNPEKINRLLVNFADGKLSNEEVFKDKGHGLFYLSAPPGFSKIEKLLASGPNRSLVAKTDLQVHLAAPAGDVMMTGPIGLVEAARRKFKLE